MKKLLSALVAMCCLLVAVGAVQPNESGNCPPPPMSASNPTV